MLGVSLKIHLSFLNYLNREQILAESSFTPFLVFSASWALVSNGHHLPGSGASGHVLPQP